MQLLRFLIGHLRHALAFPNRTATQLLHVVGEKHLKTGFLAEFNHIIDERFIEFILFGETHPLIDARGEIHHLIGSGSTKCYRCMELLPSYGLRHSGRPLRHTQIMQAIAYELHAFVRENGATEIS